MDTARLISGYNESDLTDLVGLSVASIRSRYGSMYNIPDGARATIDGRAAAESDTLGAGSEITFDAPTGTKG
jgi:hypothetical protein